MAVYTHLTPEELLRLAKGYGFSSLQTAVGIAEGVENSNFLLQGECHGKQTKAIFTVFEKRIVRSELPFFIALMQNLAQQGIACPQPLPMLGGETIGEFEGKPYCMVSFLNGQSVSAPSEADCLQLGKAMARLHVAGADAPLRRSNDLSLAGWQRIASALSPRLDTIEDGLAALVEDELSYLSTSWTNDLPRGIIHADLFPDNVFFEDGRLSGIIDFYFACEDALAYDIAICINSWCFDLAQQRFDATKISDLLAGYEHVRPLEANERAALPMLLRGAALRFLLTRAHDWLHHDASAIVSPHNPLDYARRLRIWQSNGTDDYFA